MFVVVDGLPGSARPLATNYRMWAWILNIALVLCRGQKFYREAKADSQNLYAHLSLPYARAVPR